MTGDVKTGIEVYPTAVIGLGHSERREVGQLWSRTLRNYGFAREVAVVTINDLLRPEICDEVTDMLSAGTLYSHSAFPVHLDRIDGQLGQIVAFNPPKQPDYQSS